MSTECSHVIEIQILYKHFCMYMHVNTMEWSLVLIIKMVRP